MAGHLAWLAVLFTVVHMQTKDDGWKFSSAKVKSFGNVV